MDQQSQKRQLAAVSDSSPISTDLPPGNGVKFATYIANVNKLRDIYIDSSLFRNTAWDVFLALYLKHDAGLTTTMASLAAANRLTETDCSKAVYELEAAGLVSVCEKREGMSPVNVDLTEQGRQRMVAFLMSAERA